MAGNNAQSSQDFHSQRRTQAPYLASWGALCVALAILRILTRLDRRQYARDASPRQTVAQVTIDTIRERQSTYLGNHYIVLHTTVVSVALAIAGLSAASLISKPVNPGLGLLGFLWVCSLLATAVAYGGPMTGALILPPSIPTNADLLLPLFIGATEVLMFADLTRSATLNAIIDAWFWIMAAFGFIAFLITLRARQILNTAMAKGVYHAHIIDDVRDYASRLTLWGPGLATALAIAGGVLRLITVEQGWLTWLIAGAILSLEAVGLRDFGRIARIWRNRIARPG